MQVADAEAGDAAQASQPRSQTDGASSKWLHTEGPSMDMCIGALNRSAPSTLGLAVQPAMRMHQSRCNLHSRARRQVPAAVAYATADMRLPCRRTLPTLRWHPVECHEQQFPSLYHISACSSATLGRWGPSLVEAQLADAHLPVVFLIAQCRQPHHVCKAVQQQAARWLSVASYRSSQQAANLQPTNDTQAQNQRAHSN